jgi:hypothetical protein
MDVKEYMETRVDEQINWYDSKSVRAQKKYKLFQIIEIILAATIPILSGYSDRCELIPFLIACFGSIIVIIESLTKLYKFHENWIQLYLQFVNFYN